MKETLQALHGVVGVEGAFLCDLDGNVLESTCPASLSPESLSKIGYAFSLGVRAVQSQNRVPKSIYGTFEQGRVVVRPFDQGLLIVIGNLSVKQLLLKAALDQALERLSILKKGSKESGVQKELTVIAGKVRVEQAALDPDIIEAWQKLGKGASAIKQIEVQTSGGKIVMFRIKTKNGLGQNLELNAAAIKELSIAEGESVTVRPVIQMSSEVEEFFG